jgi:ElaB/YqjD/DUF883 family membrane-anchored ribosome-binding protein
MITPTLPLAAGAMTASSLILDSIKGLYGITKSFNDFIKDHIKEMQDSENHTVSRTGKVLKSAKQGFGIGFITPVIVIATGQLILGNPLSAAATIVTAPLNPIAMTCAAVGAIYYGWSVLSDQEKNEILEKLSKGLEIGTEMIKSVIRFVTEKTKELLSPENLNEIKKFISNAASVFGKTLADVTNAIIDRVVDGFDIVKKKTGEAIKKTGDVLSENYDVIKEQGEKAIEKMRSHKGKNAEMVNQEPLACDDSSTFHIAKEIRVKITDQGQLTIPLSLQQHLGISPQSEVLLVVAGNNITLLKADS